MLELSQLNTSHQPGILCERTVVVPAPGCSCRALWTLPRGAKHPVARSGSPRREPSVPSGAFAFAHVVVRLFPELGLGLRELRPVLRRLAISCREFEPTTGNVHKGLPEPIRLLLHSIAPSKPRHVPPRSPPPCGVHVSAQQVADSCCCIHVIAASSAMGEETRSRTRAGKHATLGWFSPPHFSRDVARCGHPRRRSASLSRVVSSVVAPCGASERRACIATGDARATRAVGDSRRRSRAGPFARAAVIFFSCSSPVRSPVVVLVSRLLYGRRSVRSEGAARGGRRGTRARRAPWVVLAAAVEQGRSRAPRWSLLLLLFAHQIAGRRPRLAPSLRPPLIAE